ncbi:uncharacterized protein MCYG_03490 [Microsporum canis CBS 113480]|uniref:Uncharacterized protein n=1 Tax=Arthroderma otae (strain ATCC MYA-4605 / CBS 113480) TaxID=554155 RepID=C5FLU9_ARTOC|nr:uncharacterized protein MCYG_03490 [Microsporum canis CBS 113480]EEQ30671.1 predicted protein [Microsporum canis CBS 113480]
MSQIDNPNSVSSPVPRPPLLAGRVRRMALSIVLRSLSQARETALATHSHVIHRPPPFIKKEIALPWRLAEERKPVEDRAAISRSTNRHRGMYEPNWLLCGVEPGRGEGGFELQSWLVRG